ncbi:hypothetical protein C8A05DRAFT_19911 [Staphylotrichum tortipilum]|uniref:Uncharacterized protein n=1 Tax=Staphylotrichum tortipilum TaxID=2831512 RepID=A0AAN6MAR4_9PEZI|nr:hypothetical protein C8A05DRAFT_19911 [Staphylotrichum longicolle]
MEAASHPGCPQSLVFRIVDILARFSTRLRAEYNDTDHNDAELHSRLCLLQNTARYWTNVLVHQRTLKMWGPVLGHEHPITELLVRNLDRLHANREAMSMEEFLRGTEIAEISVLGTPLDMQPPQSPLSSLVKTLFHLNGPLPSAQALDNLLLCQDSRHHMARLQLGRQRALQALHHQTATPSDRGSGFDHAILHDNEDSIDQEPDAEIKLYRMFWLAEHRHKLGDWEGALALIHRHNAVYAGLEEDDATKFVGNHFSLKFSALHWTLLRTGDGGSNHPDDCPPSNQEDAWIFDEENQGVAAAPSFRAATVVAPWIVSTPDISMEERGQYRKRGY